MYRLFLSVAATVLLTGLTVAVTLADSADPQPVTRLLDLDPFESPEAFSQLADVFLDRDAEDATDATEVSSSEAGPRANNELPLGRQKLTRRQQVPRTKTPSGESKEEEEAPAVADAQDPQPSSQLDERSRQSDPSTPQTEQAARPEPMDADAAEAVEERQQTVPSPSAEKAPVAVPEPLTKEMEQLRDRVRGTLRRHHAADYNVYSSTSTDVMYYCLGFGTKAAVRTGNSRQPVSALGCLCYNYSFQGHRPLMLIDNRPAARIGYGRQAYPSQMFATLAESRVSVRYPMRVGKAKATVSDFVEYEKWSCRAENDMGLKLIGLAFYVGSDQTWENRDGEKWSLGRVIEAELNKPITAAPCGGVPRLTGLSHAVQRRVTDGLPVDGPYLRARKYVDVFHDHTLKIQNADGSWHPRMLRARGVSRNDIGNLRSTGMILGWLACSLPAEELDDIRLRKSVGYITNLVGSRRFSSDTPNLPAGEIAAVMHAVRALQIYDERVFQPADRPPQTPQTVASAAESQDAR